MRNLTLKFLVFILLALFIIAGCNKTDSFKGQSITFWAMPNAPNEPHKAWMDQKMAEFEAETGIKVTFEQVGWGDAWTRVTTAIATGEGADVFQVGTTWNPQLAATQGLEQINISDFGGANAFLKANLDSTMYQGKCYGVPWFAETRVLFYNKDWFGEIGLEPPQTYDELVTVGQKIVDAKGKGTAIAIAGTNAWDLIHNWAIVLWANGGQLLNADNSKAAFNDTSGVTAMKWYVDLVRNGLASEACAEYNQPQADAAFINENVGMVFMGPWNISGIINDNPDLNYGIVEPPKGPSGRHAFSGGSNLAILGSSKASGAAKEWVKFILKKENIVEYCKTLSNMLPATTEAYNDEYYKQGDFQVFKKTLDIATAYPPLGTWGDIENAIVNNFKNILSDYVNGKYTDDTVKKYLDEAAMKVNEALENE